MKSIIRAIALTTLILCPFNRIESQQPLPKPPKPIKIGQYNTFTAQNGSTIFLVSKKGYPKVRVSFMFNLPDLNTDREIATRGVLSEILAEMNNQSEIKKRFNQIKDNAGSITTHTNSYTVSGLKEDLDSMLDALSFFMDNSFIQPKEFKIAKERVALKYKERESRQNKSPKPGKTPWTDLMDSLVFTTTTPTVKIEEPTFEEVSAITIAQVKEYFNRFMGPKNTFCMVIGDFSQQEIESHFKKRLKKWRGGVKYSQAENANIITKRYPSDRRIYVKHKEGAAQSSISVKWPLGDAFPYRENEPVLKVLNQIFGESYSSYLNDNLRLDKGLCYGAKCFMNIDATGGSCTATTMVRGEESAYALENILYEMLRIRNQLVDPKVLEMAKNGLIGDFAMSMSAINSPALLGFGMVKERYNLPDNYFESYPLKIYSITAQQVREAAQRYIKPYQCIIVIEGDLKVIGKSLEQFAPVRYFNQEGSEIFNISDFIGKI